MSEGLQEALSVLTSMACDYDQLGPRTDLYSDRSVFIADVFKISSALGEQKKLAEEIKNSEGARGFLNEVWDLVEFSRNHQK